MARIKLPYYVVKKGRGYWQPTASMRRQGFTAICCGPDGADAWAVAQQWNHRWQLHRRGITPTPRLVWPKGSIGDAFERLRQTDQWERMAPRTREDWERGQRMIEGVFGSVNPSTIKLEHVDRFYAAMLREKGVDAAYRAIKHFRRLWRKMEAMGFRNLGPDPSRGFNRTTPPPRFAVWREGEVVRLVLTAWKFGYPGLACIIAIGWDTSFSPADIRKLNISHLVLTNGNIEFRHLQREKSGAHVIGTTCARTRRLIEAYLIAHPADAAGSLFRHRAGGAYTKDKLAADFRRIRELTFPGDLRRLMDMRRSGAVEAAAGAVDPTALAAKMGNTINSSRQLQKTYQPVNPASVAAADEARLRGRRKLRPIILKRESSDG